MYICNDPQSSSNMVVKEFFDHISSLRLAWTLKQTLPLYYIGIDMLTLQLPVFTTLQLISAFKSVA